MTRVPRALVVPIAAAIAFMGGFHPSIANADPPTAAVVEASQDFCVTPSTPCTDAVHRDNLGYGEVAAVNRAGKAVGKPDTVVFVCANAYRAKDGTVHDLAGHAFPGYDPGIIRGTMEVVNNATETSTRAVGRVNLFGRDYAFGTTAVAYGTQITNNATDAPVGGQITVIISGNLEDSVAGSQNSTTVHGTIRCDIHLPYVVAAPSVGGQPPDSESVVADLDAD